MLGMTMSRLPCTWPWHEATQRVWRNWSPMVLASMLWILMGVVHCITSLARSSWNHLLRTLPWYTRSVGPAHVYTHIHVTSWIWHAYNMYTMYVWACIKLINFVIKFKANSTLLMWVCSSVVCHILQCKLCCHILHSCTKLCLEGIWRIHLLQCMASLQWLLCCWRKELTFIRITKTGVVHTTSCPSLPLSWLYWPTMRRPCENRCTCIIFSCSFSASITMYLFCHHLW